MRIFVKSALAWLAETRLARRLLETWLRNKARLRLVEVDHQSVARSQKHTLLGLVHKAHKTRFGRDHDFRRIRDVRDFQRLVPLRTPAELWREYWQPAFPKLDGATWPGPIPYLAISSGQPSGAFPYIPVSAALWATQQTAALTALAFLMHARPRARLCTGRLCFLGGGTVLSPLRSVHHAERDDYGGPSESLEAVAFRQLPAVLQPFALSTFRREGGLADSMESGALADLAARSSRMPVTCVAGTVDQLRRFFIQAKWSTGKRRIIDIWPDLAAVLCARGSDDSHRSVLRSEIGSSAVLLQDLYIRPEGAVAIEDPRFGTLRLLLDHGVYFEFVPLDQVGRAQPSRYTAAEVKADVPYALAISSPAGIWACLVGSVVRFERVNPPLLRLVETDIQWQQAAAVAAPAKLTRPSLAFPAQPPHRRSAGSPAERAGSPFRMALSARADRG